jgi:hypothetical protein
MGKFTRGGFVAVAMRWASKLRFPWLFAMTAVLLVVNLFIPDPIPFADEILLGLGAVMLSKLKKRPGETASREAGNSTPASTADDEQRRVR